MPESTSPSFMPGCNPLLQLARVELLDTLYAYDGRDRSDHPLHHTYTGLWQKYVGSACEAA